MSERIKSASLVVQLLIAVTVLGLACGGGFLFGWATRDPRPPATEKLTAVIPDAEVKKAVAACRRDLSARPKARATPQGTAAPPPGETDDGGLEKAAKIEALQKEAAECRVRETMLNVHVCGTIRDHQNLLYVLTYSSSCADEVGEVGEFLVNSHDKCAEFEDFPAHLDEDKLTKEERGRVYESKWNRKDLKKDNLVIEVEEELRRCRNRPGSATE